MPKLVHLLRPLLVVALALQSLAATADPIPFTPDRWELKDAEVADHLGRPALSGTAWLKDVEFADGIIEVDLAVDRARAYPAVIFRKQGDGEYEHIYFRPHRAGLYADALQYAPSFNGVGGWQLYSGPGFTAPVTLPQQQWVHVRIEIRGTQARVFVGDAAQPALVVDRLVRGAGKGALGLRSPRGGPARFSNFSCAPDDTLVFAEPAKTEPVPGLVTDWSLSPVGAYSDLSPERYLDGKTADAVAWQPVSADDNGLVDIARHREPRAGGASKVWARTTVVAPQAEVRAFAFGYSDTVSIYLNGRIVFHGESAYRRRDPSFLGIIGWADTIHLPLEAGANELVLLVSETMGGWGFQMRDLSATYQHAALRQLWDIPGDLASPESVAFDPARRLLYVTNFGDGTLSRIGLDGTILDRRWVQDLRLPAGIKYVDGRLFVVDRTGIVELDPESGAVVSRSAVPGAGFINDLALDGSGAIYVTDSFKSCIYRIADGKAETWIDDKALDRPNGILVEPDRVLVGVSSDATLKSVDRTTRAVSTFLDLGSVANMDGLTADGRGGYLFSDYYGRLYHADRAGRRTLLLERRGAQGYCADFEYIPSLHLLVIPTLFDNRLTAFSLDPLPQP